MMRKLYLGLSHNSHTSIEYWLRLPIGEAIAWSRCLGEMLKPSKEDLHARNQNPWAGYPDRSLSCAIAQSGNWVDRERNQTLERSFPGNERDHSEANHANFRCNEA